MNSHDMDASRQLWIDIQCQTFTNWINQQIGSPQIQDLSRDLNNGVVLIRLMESLRGKKFIGKIYEDDPTEIQMLLNVQMVLDALKEDGAKTLNIGCNDVVEGNKKLILGLIWSLIQRYQLSSRSKISAKKLVMAWLQSVLPELKLTNFRTNWNDGLALSALLEYCQPGLCPEWKGLNPKDGLANCKRALKLANKYLGIPSIISAANFNSPHLDELSCITYLSYFMMKGACGYRATLRRVQVILPNIVVEDFESAWSDGYVLSSLVEAVGGRVPEGRHMKFDTFEECLENIRIALEAALNLGVKSFVKAEDIADSQGEHLGIMALAAALCSIGPQPHFYTTQCFTNQQVNLDLAFPNDGNVRVDDLAVRVIGSSGRLISAESLKLRKSRTSSGAVISIIPKESGYHQVRIYCQGSELPSSPISLHVLSSEESRAEQAFSSESRDNVTAISGENDVQKSDSSSDVVISHKSFEQRRFYFTRQLETQDGSEEQKSLAQLKQIEKSRKSKASKRAVVFEASADQEMTLRSTDIGLVSFSGLSEPCSVGSIVEVVINAHGECATGSVQVDAISPSGRVHSCTVSKRANSYTTSFTPQQVGLWKIGILYEGEHIRGSPFSCQVFDASLVQVYGLDVGLVGQELKFNVNASEAGRGNLEVSVLRHGRHIPVTFVEEDSPQVYRVNFVPDGAGQYKIHVLFNRMEVKGSPFILEIADASAVSVFGDQLHGASVGRPASFMIHAAAAGPNDITVEITAPSGKLRYGVITVLDDVSYKAEWIPQEAGEHSIDVHIFDQRVQDSPFICNVGAPEKVVVRAVPRRILTKDLHTEHSFEIDASSAGSGNLEIMINGGRVPCRVREIVSRQYKAVFTPTQSVTHTIEMRFNGEEVAGSPWHIPVEDRPERRHESNRTMSYYSELSGPGLVRAPVNKIASFEINGEGLELNDVRAKIYGPDGREFPVRIVPRGSGRYTAEYRIEQVGEHHLTVWIAGRKVDGSPLSVAGYSADRVRLEPLGGGAVGHPVQFVVDAVDAGKGQLEISVNQGRVPNNVQMQGSGRCLVTFIPQHPGTYVIDVTFNGEQVHGCPIKVEILPKQVGEVVHANLTPTAVSTAISAGGSSIAGAFRQSRAPVSPALLHHSRQRSAETNPRSPTLLREARSRVEKPWMQTYAPTSSRLSSSLSPNREWSTSTAYDRFYTTDRTLSPSDPLRTRPFTETPVIYRTPSPSTQKKTYETKNYHARSTSPSGTRSGGYAERRVRTPSPKRYEANNPSSFIGAIQPHERAYRSPSPISRDDIRSRTSDRVVSPYRITPSPISGERIRRVEQIDPMAAEEERERRRAQAEREKIACSSVGYTVAQYGQPGSVTIERCHSPDRYSLPRSYTETYDKKESHDTVSPSSFYSKQRPDSPEYSAVYERFDRKRDEPPPAPAHAQANHSVTKTDVPSGSIRSRSPPPDYDAGPSVTQSLATSVKTYDEPTYSQPTTTERTTYTTSPKQSEKDIETKPDYGVHRTVSEAEEKLKSKSKEDLSYLRTQSEFIRRKDPEQVALPRTDEKYQIFDTTPEKLKRTNDLMPLPLAEEAQRTMEYLRVRAEDDEILQQHGYGKRSHEPSIEIQEPASEIRDDVIEVAGSRDDLHKKPLDTSLPQVQALEPVAELPHSPAPSAKSTPHTTPKTSMKFKKEVKEVKPFEFGKSKFTSKHEVVKRGKNVEVKLENLKLTKEDTLRVVVLPPMRNQFGTPGDTQNEVETKVKRSGSKYEISFKPTEVGTHKVFAYVNEIQHPLSPFPIRVYDSSEIIVGEIPAQSNLNDTVEFTVDAGRAGFGNLEMAIKDADGVIIPSHVAQLESGTAKFLVTFTPTSKGQHTVNITFNKEVLKNSPFEVLITDPPAPLNESFDGTASPSLSKKDMKKEKEDKKKEEKERAKREKEEKGATLKKERKSKHRIVSKTSVTKIPSLSRVGQPSSIIVEVAGHDQLEIIITDNKKNQIGTELIEIEPGVMQVNFTPQVVGDHDIEVKYGGVPVTAIPFTCRAYDPAKIKVGTIPKGLLDKPVYFTVDASEAGVGNLEVAVNDGRVPSMAHALGQHRYDISFVPKENADHTITIRFNNEPVPGSPFTCQLVTAAQASASGPGLERVPVDESTEIKIQTSVASDSQPEVRVRDPMGIDLPVEITSNEKDETLFVVKYTPKCVGNHQVDISMLGEPIAGSPFTAKAYDARMARLSQCDQAIVGKPCTFAIDAARAGAGNMEIIVSVDNHNVPNFVQAEGQAKFKVSFTPQEAKEHVISVRFNGVSVPGSPMRCMVQKAQPTVAPPPVTSQATSLESSSFAGSAPEQSNKFTLAKDLENAQVGKKHGFTIPNPDGRAAECNVVVIAPDGTQQPVTITTGNESFFAEFTPRTKGSHQVNIYLDKIKSNEMPILVEVENGGLTLPTVCLVGKRYAFDIEADDKDDVHVNIVDPHLHPLPVQIEKLSDGLVRASCRFREVGLHSIETFVGGQAVGGPVQKRVVDSVNAVRFVSEVRKEVVRERAEHKILIASGLEDEVDVTIRDPDRTPQTVTLSKSSDTLWIASWLPTTEGCHQLEIFVGGMPIAGSPFSVPVLDPSAVRVIGLRNDQIGVEQQFNIDYTDSGALSASVEIRCGANSIPCNVKRIKPGLLLCSFTPSVGGLYQVNVHIDGLILPECPYECNIGSGALRASGDALRRAQRGRVARFEVSLDDMTNGDLDVMISDPSGGPLPVRCYRQQDDSYWVEFIPEHTGTHTIEVTFGDVPVTGSPFRCEVVDPKKVRVSGLGEGLLLRHATTFHVDRREAGDGELFVEVNDPMGAPLKVETLKSPGGEDCITFLPSKTGPHKVNVKVAGFPVPGYPRTVVVSEQQQPTVYGAAVDHSIKIDEPASLIFDPKGSSGGIKVNVFGPKDNKVRHKVIRRPNGTSEVVFSPEEVGSHLVHIEFNNKPIAGSPFTVRVVDPSKVVVNDLDMDRDGTFLLRLGQQNVFDVDATAAGPGKLRAEVRNSESTLLGDGPAVDDLGYGKYRVTFTPKQPGRYSIYLYWNELPVENAFPVRARSSEEKPTTSHEKVAAVTHTRDKSSSSIDELSKVMVRGDGLHRAQLKEPNEFIVDGSDISREGRLTATLFGTKADVPVRVQQLGNNIFKGTYTPLTGGTYELHILWNGIHVKGSPFKVNADTASSPAELITVDSSSLKIGIINDDIKTVIDTRRAGPGQLSAQCMGPVKLAYCELYDHRDGTYTLSVKPTEVGKHTLTIKYDDQHVRGSPFIIHVSLPPDPSKVRVYGPGIEHGILSLFKSNFVVETRGAGAGQLTVRVRGPKGAFNVEMQREKKNERTIHCKYEPKEPGDYQVEVKWHGEHVPGSPFLVMIVDTEQELSRFLRGEAPSPTPATPFVPPGWVGPPPLFPPPMGQRYGPPIGPMGPMGPIVPPPPGAMMPLNGPPPQRHKAKYH